MQHLGWCLGCWHLTASTSFCPPPYPTSTALQASSVATPTTLPLPSNTTLPHKQHPSRLTHIILFSAALADQWRLYWATWTCGLQPERYQNGPPKILNGTGGQALRSGVDTGERRAIKVSGTSSRWCCFHPNRYWPDCHFRVGYNHTSLIQLQLTLRTQLDHHLRANTSCQLIFSSSPSINFNSRSDPAPLLSEVITPPQVQVPPQRLEQYGRQVMTVEHHETTSKESEKWGMGEARSRAAGHKRVQRKRRGAQGK